MSLLLAATAVLAADGSNLVDNPSFSKKKAGEPIYRWTISTREGRTRFRVVDGVLTAERTTRSGLLPDSCYQWINLPAGTSAVRLSLRAGTEAAERVEVVVRFKDRDGGPISSTVALRLKGTGAMRMHERDVLVPANAWDVEIAFVMRGAGKARFDDVSLTAVDPTDTKEVASVVMVTGGAAVKWVGTKPEEPIRFYLPVPPATESQTPIRLEVRTFPPGKIVSAAWDVTRGTGFLRLALTPLHDPGDLRVLFTAKVVVYERPVYRGLPDQLPLTGGGRIPRTVQPFLAVEGGSGLSDLAPRLDPGRGDLRSLASRAALVLARRVRTAGDGPVDPDAVAAAKRGSPPGIANLAAALLRKHGVPARVVAIVTVGKGSRLRYILQAWHRDQGWLRFGTLSSDPLPMPFADAVVIGVAGRAGWPDPLAPGFPAGTEGRSAPAGGFTGGEGAFRSAPVGSFTLPRGSVPDFAASAGKAWEKALRRVKVESGRARAAMVAPLLKGKASGAKDDLAGFLGK